MTDQRVFALIPPVDTILKQPSLQQTVAALGREPVKLAIRAEVDILRRAMASAAAEYLSLSREVVAERVAEAAVTRIGLEFKPLFRPVFNLTGTVIHTNLGRSRLPDSAIAAMAIAAGEAVDLEYNLETGKRGDRDSHLEALICELTGAEAATVVNNNAAAVVLLLNTLALGQEVIISRGELVEIGGAFRIPDVMESAGAKLREVGTTNRTHARDFEAALSPQTALVMKVHASNYEIRGFTSAVPEAELAAIAHGANIPFVSDLGSGCLVDMARFGLPPEPTVRATVEAGADLVTFSGDKLLGGPQSGIIVGRADLIKRIKENPLKRALRVDKTVLAGLLSVLQLYRDPESLPQRLPLLADLTRSVDDIEKAVQRVLPVVREAVGEEFVTDGLDCKSQIGSGALPLELMPSRAIAISLRSGQSDAALTELAATLRALPKPIIGRLSDGSLILDLRCLRDEQGFCEQLRSL